MMSLFVIVYIVTLLTEKTLPQPCKPGTFCALGLRRRVNFYCNGSDFDRKTVISNISNAILSLSDCNFKRFKLHSFIRTNKIPVLELVNDHTSNRTFSMDILFRKIPSMCRITILHSRTGGPFQLKFQKMDSLTILQIKEHDFTTFPNQPFRNLTNLETLLVTNGPLASLPSDLFRGLDRLLELDLRHNEINKIESALFSNLKCLRILFLSGNKIKRIDSSAFSNLTKLSVFRLDRNKLEELPPRLFRYCPEIGWLFVSGNVNLRRFPDGFFRGSTHLSRLIASNCSIEVIQRTLFSDTQLVRAKGNKQEYFPSSNEENISFKDMQNMNISVLSRKSNQLLSKFSQTSYGGLNVLGQLDLSNNKLKEIRSGTFNTLQKLLLVNLSHNPLRYLPKYLTLGPNTFLSNIDLSHCDLYEMPNIDLSAFRVDSLDLSHNKLTDVTLPVYSISTPNVILDYNNISNIQLYFGNFKVNSPRYSLVGNALVCDCELKRFLDFIHSPLQTARSVFSNKSIQQKCRVPNDVLSLVDVPLDFMHCIMGECVPTCKCEKVSKQKVSVNCSNLQLHRVPSKLPPGVIIVHLENNRITSISTSDPSWNKVTDLYITGNRLVTTANWVIPPELKKLYLDENRLQDLPAIFRSKIDITPNISLLLKRNNWTCDCRSASLIEWMQQNQRKIADYEQVTCSYKNDTIGTSFVAVKDVAVGMLCMDDPSTDYPIVIVTVEPTEQSEADVQTVLSVAIPIMLMVICAAFYLYRHKHSLLALMHAYRLHCGFLDRGKAFDDMMYDAFLCYVPEDRRVARAIVRRLEPQHKICMPERDWQPGGNTSEKILYSMQNSKTIIMLLSRNFVLSAWFQEDFRIAYTNIREDVLLRVVPIYINEFRGVSYLPDDLRYLLSLKSHIKWRERFFWEKLKFSLRSPSTS